MFLFVVWDLSAHVPPSRSVLVRTLRQVGGDVSVLLGADPDMASATRRSAGYPFVAQLTAPTGEPLPVSVLSRLPLSDVNARRAPTGVVGSLTLHLGGGEVGLLLADLIGDTEESEQVTLELLHQAHHRDGAVALAGDLGWDLNRPVGPVAAHSAGLVDAVEVAGGHVPGVRTLGVLTRGLRPRGSGTVRNAPYGPLVWVRLSP